MTTRWFFAADVALNGIGILGSFNLGERIRKSPVHDDEVKHVRARVVERAARQQENITFQLLEWPFKLGDVTVNVVKV